LSDFNSKEVAEHMTQAYPLLHGGILRLMSDFIDIKRNHGHDPEKEVYNNIDIITLAHRIATCRCITFVGHNDSYILRDGTEGSGSWKSIGTNDEKEPKILRNYMSYDELLLSAMGGISSPTHFINTGNRNNRGIPSKGKHLKDGIYIGMIGARFEKFSCMEYSLMIMASQQNTTTNGYGVDAHQHVNEILCTKKLSRQRKKRRRSK